MTPRSQHFCPIYDASFRSFKENILPTYKDVLLAYMSESSKGKCHPPYAKIMNAVIDQVLSVWNSASIPALSVKRCQDMIKSHHDRYNDMKKNYSRDKDRSSFKEKLETFREFSDKLFDIAFCKCSSKCTCPRELKIPEADEGTRGFWTRVF